MLGLFQAIRAEWKVLKKAPGAFFIIALAFLGFGFAAGELGYPILHPQPSTPKDGTALATPIPTPKPSVAEDKTVAGPASSPPARPAPHARASVRQSNPEARATGSTITVGNVSSVGQRGGVTAGSVGNVDQSSGGE